MPENRLEKTRKLYARSGKKILPLDIEIAAIYQLLGGSDSGGIYRQALKILDIYLTPDGLVIEVD